MQNTSFRAIFPFFVVIIIDTLASSMLAPLLAPMISSSQHFFGNSDLLQHILYGIVLAAFPLSYMIGSPLLGALSDHYGRRNVLLICLLGALVGFIFYTASFLCSSIVLLIVGRVIAGVAAGSQGVAQAAMADISSGKEKAINISTIAVALTIGLGAGPLLAGLLSNAHLVHWFTLTTPFYFVIALSLINLFLLLKWIPKKFDKNAAALGMPRLSQQIKDICKKSHSLLFIFFLFELGWSLYFQSLALFLAKIFHYDATHIGFFLSYVSVVLCLQLVFLVRWCVKWFTLKNSVGYALGLGLLSLFSLFIFHSLAVQLLLAVVITGAVALIYPFLITFLSDHVTADEQGLLMGLSDAILALAFAITGFLSGWLAYFSVTIPFVIASGFWLIALIIFSLTRHKN